MISNKEKTIFVALSYVEHLFIFGLVVVGCVPYASFTSLVRIPIGNASSAVGLKTCVVTEGIKKYKSLIRKKKKHNNIVLSENDKLNKIEILIYRALLGSYICHDEFVLVNHLLAEYNDMKEEIKKLQTLTVHQGF